MSSSRKAQAIRQLSRDATQSSVATSHTSSSASFDISGEALHSTRPFEDFDESFQSRELTRDNTVRTERDVTRDSLPPGTLPHIRSTAKKYGAWQPYNGMSETKITSSAVRNEFKDFDHAAEFDQGTQTSSDFTDESISIEHKRGLKRGSRNTAQQFNSSFAMSPIPLRDSLYDVTPPAKRSARNSPQQQSPLPAAGSLRRDTHVRRASGSPSLSAPAARDEQANKPRKTTLSQVHAIATDDESLIDEQPPTVTLTRPARFGTTRSRKEPAQEQITPARKSQRALHNIPRSETTAQSFILPDLPNLTELVSGVFQNGSPVFNRTALPRVQFSAPPPPGRLPNHNRLESVPIPSEEKAIFASLQLLQEKVAQLEKEKAEAEKRMEEQDNEIIHLKAVQDAEERMRRPDSGLGSTDGEGSGDRRGWRVEKTKLQTSINALQIRVDRAERKASVAEISTKRATGERDALVTQLGVAFYNIEEVKAEREALAEENEDLHSEIDELRAENEELRNRLSEADDIHTQNEQLRLELARETARREEEQHAMRDSERQSKREQYRQARREEKLEQQRQAELQRDVELQRQAKVEEGRQAQLEEVRQAKQEEERRARQEDAHRAKLEEERRIRREEDRLRREEERRSKRAERQSSQRHEKDTQARIADRVQQEIRDSKVLAAAQPSEQPKSRASRFASTQFHPDSQRFSMPAIPVRSVSNPEPSVSKRGVYSNGKPESTTDLSLTNVYTSRVMPSALPALVETKPLEPMAHDYTELSFIRPDDIVQLRKKLEAERAANRKNRASAQPLPTREDTIRSMASAKSGRPQSLHGTSTKDNTVQSNFEVQDEGTRDFTSHSHRNANTQPQQPEDSVLSNISRASHRRRSSAPVEETSAFIVPDITMSRGWQPTVDNLSKFKVPSHDNKNCTVCARDAGRLLGHHFDIDRPVPVSKRTADDVDATLRPTQSPKVALALVLKELEDEVSHLHLELSAHEQLLRCHDPSLGRRKRKAMKAAMEDLLRRIDIKSDQIYNLYDVVEGQHADDLTEEDIEVTLRNITEAAKKRAAAKRTEAAKKVVVESHHSDASSGSDEEEEGEEPSLPHMSDIFGHDEDVADDASLPFEGFSDTESLPAFGKAGRRGVF